jgi:hypothetical protein
MTKEINVYITYDLIMELLSYGEEIKIDTSKSLVKQIILIHKNILNKYN